MKAIVARTKSSVLALVVCQTAGKKEGEQGEKTFMFNGKMVYSGLIQWQLWMVSLYFDRSPLNLNNVCACIQQAECQHEYCQHAFTCFTGIYFQAFLSEMILKPTHLFSFSSVVVWTSLVCVDVLVLMRLWILVWRCDKEILVIGCERQAETREKTWEEKKESDEIIVHREN